MLGVLAGGRSAASATSLSIAVNGNHFVNGAGATVRIPGVNVPGTEYACDQSWGYAGFPLTVVSAQVVAAWHANAVRVPLNEDCWLGLNGQPSYGTMAGQRQAHGVVGVGPPRGGAVHRHRSALDGYHWSVVSVHLPSGLHLKAAGVISGKAKTSGAVVCTVQVVDHKTKSKPPTQHSAQKTLSNTVHRPFPAGRVGCHPMARTEGATRTGRRA